MHARYYSPNLGRFLSVDSVGGSAGSSQSWNRYSYVLNNPLNFWDPTGNVAVADDLLLAAAVTTAMGSIIALWNAPAVGDDSKTNGEVILGSINEAIHGLGILLSNATNGPYSGMTDDQLAKSADSYEDLIRKHEKLIRDYVANPDALDNQGKLKDADADLRQKITDGRVNTLEKQLKKQKRELEKIREEQDRRLGRPEDKKQESEE